MTALSIITFGDVFRYKERDYVYLGSTEDSIFTAKILQPQETHDVLEMARRFDANPRITRNRGEILYFVILNTHEVKNRMANLARTDGNDANIYVTPYCKLNEEDLKSLKEKIVDKDTPVPEILKDIVKDIEI